MYVTRMYIALFPLLLVACDDWIDAELPLRFSFRSDRSEGQILRCSGIRSLIAKDRLREIDVPDGRIASLKWGATYLSADGAARLSFSSSQHSTTVKYSSAKPLSQSEEAQRSRAAASARFVSAIFAAPPRKKAYPEI